jgi:hypothetical protein
MAGTWAVGDGAHQGGGGRAWGLAAAKFPRRPDARSGAPRAARARNKPCGSQEGLAQGWGAAGTKWAGRRPGLRPEHEPGRAAPATVAKDGSEGGKKRPAAGHDNGGGGSGGGMSSSGDAAGPERPRWLPLS